MENLGTALKTITANFTEMKENISLEDADADLDVNDVETALESVGIALRDSTGQIRDLDDVINNLGMSWQNLSRNTQRYLATTIAGSRQQSRLIALLDDYDRTLELEAIAMDSEGQADLQFAKYADTIEYRINQISTQWEEFTQTLLNSDTFKSALDTVISFLDRLNSFDISGITLLLTAGFIPALKSIVTSVGTSLKNTANNMRSIGSIIGQRLKEGILSNDYSVHIQADISQAEADLVELRSRIAQLQADNVGVDISGNEDFQKYNSQIQATEQRLESLRAEANQVNASMNVYSTTIRSAASFTSAFALALMNGADAEAAFDIALATLIPQIVSMGAELLTANIRKRLLEKTTKSHTQAVNENTAAENLNTAARNAGTASSLARTQQLEKENRQLALNTSQTENQTKSSGALTKILGKLSGKTGSIAAIAIAVAAVIAATAQFVSLTDEYEKQTSVTERLEKATKDLEEAQRNYNEALQDTKTLRETTQTLEEAADTYERLSKITNRTDNQNTELDEAVSTLISDHPEILSFYDEENNKISINNQLYEQKIELLKQEREEQDALTSFYNQQQIQLKRTQAILQNMSNIEAQTGLTFNAAEGINDSTYFAMTSETGYNASQVEHETLESFWENINNEAENFDVEFDNDAAVDAWNYLYDNAEEGLQNLDSEVQLVLNQWKNSIEEIKQINDGFADYYSNIYQDLVASGNYADEQQAGIAASVIAGQFNAVDNIDFSKFNTYEEIVDDSRLSEQILGFTAGGAAAGAIAGSTIPVIGNAIGTVAGGIVGTIVGGVAAYIGSSSIYKGSAQKDMTSDLEKTLLEIRESDASFTEEQAKESAEKYQEAIYDITNDFWDGAQQFEDLDSKTKKMLEAIGVTAENYDEYVKNLTDAELSDKLSTDFMNSEITKFQEELQEDLEEFFASAEGQDYLEDVADFLNTESKEMTNNQMLAFVEQQRNLWAEKLGLDRDSAIIDEILKNQGFDAGLVEEGMYSSFAEAAEILGQQAEIYANNVSSAIADATVGMYARIVEETDNELLAQQMVKEFDNTLTNSGIDEDIQQIFYGVDWSSFDVGIMNLDDFLNDIVETNELTESEYQKLLEISEIAQKYGQLDTMVDTIAEANSFMETLDEQMKDLYDQTDSYVNVISDQINEGEVSLENYLAFKDILSELGLNVSDYFNIDENGIITTNTEKIDQLYKDQLKAREQQLDLQISQLDVQIAQLNNEKTNLDIQAQQIDEGYTSIDVIYDKVNATAELCKLQLAYLNMLREENGEERFTESDFDFTYRLNTSTEEERKNAKELVESQRESIEAQIDSAEATRTYLLEQREGIGNEGVAYLADYNRRLQESVATTEDLEEAQNEVNDALKEVTEAQEGLNEALEEYNELLYGSENRQSSLDFLYNYSEALDTFNSQIESAKENLNESSSIDAAIDSWEEYGNAAHNALAQEQARQRVIQQGLNNYADMIKNGTASYQNKETGETISINFGDYASYDERTGKYQVDQALLNQARFNDSYKDLIEEQIETYNTYVDEYETSRDNIEQIEKEFQEQIETANSNYAAMEDEIANVLKEKYQEEVDNLQEKYSAMKEADNDYLSALQEAINKQRELRDRENDYEELAQQERRLALMRRDTSGTTQTEVMELEDQISETRQNLLDSEVDSIISGMQDIYESQQELRDVEIELKTAIMNNTAYWNQQAASIAETFTTADDFVAWIVENDSSFAEQTITRQEVLMTEYYDTGAAAMQKYAMDSIGTVENYLLVTTQEVQELANNTGESFTTEVTRAFNETTAQVLEDLASAKEGVDDAKTALDEANAALKEATTNLNNLKAAADEFKFGIGDSGNGDEEDYTMYTDPIGPDVGQKTNNQSGETMTQRVARIKATMNNEKIEQGVSPSESIAMNSQEYSYILEINGGALNGKYYASSDSIDLLKDFVSKPSVVEEWLRGAGQTALAGNWPYKIIHDKSVVGSGLIAFAKGGLVDYTGPAWVDGTPSKPEAFLSAEDTQRIAQLTSVLSNIPLLNLTPNTENISSTSYGDTQIEINLNIDSLSSDIDVENMLDRMKQEIVDVATPVGTTNILRR